MPWPEMLLEIPVMAGNRLRQQAIVVSPWPEMLLGIPEMVEIQES